MTQWKFRPRLESMDERIVPDAAPIAAPGPQAADLAAQNPAPSPGGMTNDELDKRIGQIDAELNVSLGAQTALNNAILVAVARLNAALAAGAAAATPAALLVAQGRIQDSRQALNDLERQLQDVVDRIAALEEERAMLYAEWTRRQQAGPNIPVGPVTIADPATPAV